MAGMAITLADRVATAINAKSDYSNSLTPNASRSLLVNLKANHEKTTALRVDVCPVSFVSLPSTRRQFDEDYIIRVFVVSPVTRDNGLNTFSETEVANFLTLVEEIQSQVITYADSNPQTLLTLGGFTNDPMISDDFLESGKFLSVTEFTFRVCREV